MSGESARQQLRVVTVTVSDIRKRADDDAGKVLDEAVRGAGHAVVRHVLVKDEPKFIQELVQSTSNDNAADAVILSGGTGIAPRDQTFEALEKIFEKRMDGFGEVFRRLFFDEIGPLAILTRATAGVVNGCVVYSLPGSVNAVRLGMERLVLPTLVAAVALAAGHADRDPAVHSIFGDVPVPHPSIHPPPPSSRFPR